MAKIDTRFYVVRKGAGGTALRYWQPTAKMRAAGWETEALASDELTALGRVRELNGRYDAWRRKEGPAGNHAMLPEQEARMAIGANGGPPLAAPAPAKGPSRMTVGWLIDAWYKTAKWTAPAGSTIKPFKPKTQKFYRWAAEILRAWAEQGHTPIRAITAADVQTLYEEFLVVSHSKANAVVTVLRMLLEYARRKNLVDINVALRPGLISLPPRIRIVGHDEQACLIAHADALGLHSMGDAIMLGHDMGQREGDILVLTRLRYRDGRFYLKQRKTSALVDVPASPRLARRIADAIARIDAMAESRRQLAAAAGRPAPATPAQLVVYEATGVKYGEHHFRHMYARVRAAAAGERFALGRNAGRVQWNDEDLARTAQLRKAPSLLGRPAQDDEPALVPANFQDLRDTYVTNAAEGGATIPQICAVTGHTEKSAYNILKHYLALNGAMASEAIARAVELYDRREAEAKAQAQAAREDEA